MFDYFNIIVKEYMMSLDKWRGDTDYTNAIRDKFKVIDEEFKQSELDQEIPECLTKELAEQLIEEKEKNLMNVFSQVQ